jgi:radical SAM superfamily enzyme YgiQ (UPF0313 family)
MDNSMAYHIIDYLTKNQMSFLTNSFDETVAKFKNVMGFDDSVKTCVLGGFDNQIFLIQLSIDENAYAFSIGKPLIETAFYLSFSDKIIVQTHFCGSLMLKADFLFSIMNPVKIAFISLAKREVYTFPRFALGVSVIAHALRNQFLSEITLYDMQINDKKDILEKIAKQNYDIIGLSITFGLFDVMEEFILELQKIVPEAKIILGGSLAAIEYNVILEQFPNVIVSLGEGEKCMPEIVNWHKGLRKIDEINDIAYINNKGELTVTKHIDTCVSSLSLPELDLLLPTIKCKGVFQLELSRGCYNACSFCPRKHKGNWRPIISDISELDSFLDLYCKLLVFGDIDPKEHIVFIVDEEFIGGNTAYNRNRIEKMCFAFFNKGIHFETSFRMSAVYSEGDTIQERDEKLSNIKKIHNYGLSRVLIGVESGIDSVLKRFNKNINSIENIQGIRFLTALGVPVRFTYITFDPLMTFDELIETYLFQGKTDLIMREIEQNQLSIINLQNNYEVLHEYKMGVPFYYYIPYMLVSLECLIASAYYNNLHDEKLLEENTVTALGKKNAKYIDWKIGIISQYSQLWIDRNFTLDYTLKSLGKIYHEAKSEEIRAVRTRIKENSYKLLGKMIYIINGKEFVIENQLQKEKIFVKELVVDVEPKRNIIESKMRKLLNFQINMLFDEVDEHSSRLKKVLCDDDFIFYLKQIDFWKNNHEWKLLNGE